MEVVRGAGFSTGKRSSASISFSVIFALVPGGREKDFPTKSKKKKKKFEGERVKRNQMFA